MYDWSFSSRQAYVIRTRMFQLLLKGCTIEARKRSSSMLIPTVSVVVERMYDWSCLSLLTQFHQESFSCCWKDVRLKRGYGGQESDDQRFQLLLKGCTIEAVGIYRYEIFDTGFQLLLKGCTIEALLRLIIPIEFSSFSCCWKDVRLKLYKFCHDLNLVGFSCCWKDVRLKLFSAAAMVRDNEFQLLLKGCTIEAPKPTDWKQMIFDSWFLICFSKMVDLHKKCHYFRKFGVIWVIAWLFLIVVVTSSYILSTTKSP